MAETYYDVLDLSRKPSKDELLFGYMRLACKWHPENHKNNKDAEDRFQLIGEAFCVLFDTKARFAYDKSLKSNPSNESGRRVSLSLEKTEALFHEMVVRYIDSELQLGSSEEKCIHDLSDIGCPQDIACRLAQRVFEKERERVRRSALIMLAFGACISTLGIWILSISYSARSAIGLDIHETPLALGFGMMTYATYCLCTGRPAISVLSLFNGTERDLGDV